MSATQPAPAARRPRPAATWLAFSAAVTAQLPPIAGRGDLTATAAPGAGRGAAACFIHGTAEIEVDGNYLGIDPATADPASPADRERYPALWGAIIHECAHSRHSRWHAPKGTNAAWAEAAKALEESRIEAAQTARRPGDRTWLRATARQIVIGDFAAAATPPGSPAEAGSAAALILARADAGILEPGEAAPVEKAVAAAIGEGKLGQLRQVWREARATADDDAKAMVALGRRWCRILGITPDQPAPKAGPGQPGRPGERQPGQSGQGTPSPVAEAVSEAAEAVAAASAAEFAPAPAFPPGKAEARDAENAARRQAENAAGKVFPRDPVAGAGGYGGVTGLTRDPDDDEQAAARALARALKAATAGGRAETTVTSPTPPGRLRMKQAMAADAQRAAGALPTARPFTRTQRRRVPAPPIAVAIACDVSGSMSAYTRPVASAAWILARATASLPAARTATVTFGTTVRPVTYPGAAPAKVAQFTASGAKEDFTTAIAALDGALGLADPRTTRVLVIVSDGHYKDTQYPDGQKLITRLAASGCHILWIAPDENSRPMKGTLAVTLDSPSSTSKAIALAITAATR